MASAQVEEFTKSTEETTIGSPTIEAPAKAPATHNIESPYDEDDDEEITLPDELEKQDHLDDKENQKSLEPQIIDDEDDDEEEGDKENQKPLEPQIIDDEDDDDEEEGDKENQESALNSTGRSTDFSEEEGDEDEE